MSLEARLDDDLKASLRAGDAERRGVIQMLRSRLQLEKKRKGSTAALDDAVVVRLVQAYVKQVQEALEQAERAGRADLVERARRELAVAESYLPAPLRDEELAALVADAVRAHGGSGARAMGAVMKEVLARGAGRVDGRRAQEAVKRALGLA